jgi:hypothetical protein
VNKSSIDLANGLLERVGNEYYKKYKETVVKFMLVYKFPEKEEFGDSYHDYSYLEYPTVDDVYVVESDLDGDGEFEYFCLSNSYINAPGCSKHTIFLTIWEKDNLINPTWHYVINTREGDSYSFPEEIFKKGKQMIRIRETYYSFQMNKTLFINENYIYYDGNKYIIESSE